MKAKHTYSNGAFVTITTRRANYSTRIYGKATIFPTKQAYDHGDCRNVTEVKDFYLCESDENLAESVNQFISHLESDANELVTSTRIILEWKGHAMRETGFHCTLCVSDAHRTDDATGTRGNYSAAERTSK